MAKKLVVLTVVLTILLVAVTSAAAITNGMPDGDGHPYVGVVADDPVTNSCSGVAISPSVFLTAAHCFPFAQDGDPVLVTFSTSPINAELHEFYAGLFYRHPNYCAFCGPGLPGALADDIAVVWILGNYLGEAPELDRYGLLPALGLNDTLPNMTDVTLVGYGYQNFIRGYGPPIGVRDNTRHVTWANLIASSQANGEQFIKLSAAQGNGNGGACLGDSGGPVLLGESDVILALSSYGANDKCAGVTYSSRIDTESAQGFIGAFLP